jgi:prepilin-type N-terminal cleavage/methylation domain-containing protein
MLRGYRKAFTLIELLIVVAIIAILAAIAVPNFLEAQVRSKVARAKSDMRSLVVAMEAMRVDRNALLCDFWDDDQGDCDTWSMRVHGVHCIHDNRGGTTGVLVPLTTPVAYITSIPVDVFAEKLLEGYLYPELIASDWQKPHTYLYVGNNPHWPVVPEKYGLQVGEYKLQTCGPDRKFNLYYGTFYMYYDPTNGTTSEGDIIYTSRSNFEPYPGWIGR